MQNFLFYKLDVLYGGPALTYYKMFDYKWDKYGMYNFFSQ